MSRSIRKYTEEFKREAVALALKSPSVSKVAKELGVPLASLHTWIKKLKTTLISSSPKNDAKDITALIEENRRLHKALAIAEEEKAILKKAAQYFAQHQK
jgi:transposase